MQLKECLHYTTHSTLNAPRNSLIETVYHVLDAGQGDYPQSGIRASRKVSHATQPEASTVLRKGGLQAEAIGAL